MTKSKAQFGYALLVPAILALSISGAAAQKQSAAAMRAECMRQATEAVSNISASSSPAATSERNSRGVSIYRECARKNGIRP
jgi:hypothetical protein